MPGQPGSTVEVDGRVLYFECEGTGSPTVLLEAGLGADMTVWTGTSLETAQFTRVCRYDRAGLGLTSAQGNTLIKRTRTAKDQLEDLKGLVDRGIDAPLILVGHSWGGALVRMFANDRPNDVAGVVLVDAYVPGVDQALLAALPPKRAGESGPLADFRARFSETNVNVEQLAWTISSAQVAQANDLGNTPLVVITAGNDPVPGLSARINDRLEAVWFRLQKKLAALSGQSVHAVAKTSSHMVQWDQPEVVVGAIRGLVEAQRRDQQLPSCPQLLKMRDVACLK